MLTVHFTKVAEATQWDRIDVRELDCFVNDCRFAVVENYSRGERLPKRRRVVSAQRGGQELSSVHRREWYAEGISSGASWEFCLTCGEREAEVPAGAF